MHMDANKLGMHERACTQRKYKKLKTLTNDVRCVDKLKCALIEKWKEKRILKTKY